MSKPNRFLPHTGTKELAKKLAVKLAEQCKGKSPQEADALKADFLEKISIASKHPVENT